MTNITPFSEAPVHTLPMSGEMVSLERIKEQMEALWLQEADALKALHEPALHGSARSKLVRLLGRVREDRAKLYKILCKAEMTGAEQIHWSELVQSVPDS